MAKAARFARRSAEVIPLRPDLAPPTAERRPTVSVVMVVYMTGEVLADSLAHLLAEPRVDEIILVDNGSTPGELSQLREAAAADRRVQLETGHGNIGFAKGANRGAGLATGEVLVFLNPDAKLQPDCVEQLCAALATEPRLAVVGACVLNPDGTEQRGGRRGEVTPFTTVLSFTHASRFVGGSDIHHEGQPLPDGVIALPTISGACFAMRRRDFYRLDGFDEGYFLHVEDVDICWRARRDGGVVLFQPAAKVIHEGHSSHINPTRVEFHKGRGLARYFRLRAHNPQGWLAAVALGPLIVVTAVARPLLWKLTGRRI